MRITVVGYVQGMDLAPSRLLRGIFIAWLAAVALCAFGVSHAAPVHATSPLTSEDSPAPDDGGDSSGDDGSDPTDEPTEAPSEQPTVAPTQAPTPSVKDDQSANRPNDGGSNSGNDGNDDQASTNSDSDDQGNNSGAVTGFTGDSGDATADDPKKSTAHRAEPAESGWSSSLGWVLLTGGLASAAGAFAVYRRDPAVLAWPWLGHAH